MPGNVLPFDLRSLGVFLTVFESGTMSGAARTLGITQSAISQIIADLELETKTALFDRNVRPLGLTLSGVVLRQRASALLADARQIAPLLRQVRQGKLPLIRVGLVDSMARLLLPALSEYLLGFTDHVSFLTGFTSSHVDDIFRRRLEIFVGVDEFDVLDGLETWPVLDEPYIVIAPHDTPAIRTIDDLHKLSESLHFSRYHPRRKVGVAIERHLRRIGLELPRSQEFDTPFGVTASVATGRCWAITTPLCVFETQAFIDKFRCYPLPGPGFKRRLSLIARSRELADVPKRVADFACGRIRDDCLPVLAAHLPWVERSLSIGSTIQADA
jgi:DNA-binding transcriptional LysR family regulator